jgi:hypothetical protein
METWTWIFEDMKRWRHGDMDTGHIEAWRHGDGNLETWIHRYGDMETWRNGDKVTSRDGDMETSKGKRTPRRFSLIRLPFAHCANRSFSFVRFLITKN